ncbi:glucose-1-phosphate adenylyltransferase family protein [Arsenicicoccus piscis]|uniref:Glucose-1-phosphate adenylyltransferase n=1 Tax=Arsenicicoccus piscis TaxID=673954 RepID=A0ABQ6HU60_9MICO|nr:sugar phosphate nucleotidyltransferase [Arsenicicoccus piscis]GMA21393.1 glucose-1-phosphate adenylyltransferase [Arsenicicoccus piscis]
MSRVPAPDAPTVLALVQAGGQGSRMDVLTRERAKPALPFAGSYQLIDIALSNLANSGIDDVWVSVQYQASSLDEHLQSGRPWDLDRTSGGYRRLVPEEGRGGHPGFSTGNADDLYRLSDHLRAHEVDLLVLASADQVFRLDLAEVIQQHLARGSECTIVTTEVSKRDASHKAVVVSDATGLVTQVLEKPAKPPTGTISAEVLVFDRELVLDLVDALHRELDGDDEGASGLGDLAEHLLPRLVARGATHAFALPGYWRDMGRPEAYLGAHRDLVRGRVDLFDDLGWPMRSNQPDTMPALVRSGAVIEDSVLAPGCVVAGTVRGSVLGPGALVERDAVVEDSVLLAGARVEAKARVSTAVLDESVVVGRGLRWGPCTPAVGSVTRT